MSRMSASEYGVSKFSHWDICGIGTLLDLSRLFRLASLIFFARDDRSARSWRRTFAGIFFWSSDMSATKGEGVSSLHLSRL